MHFGATLRLLRVESGLSLRNLARRLNVSSAYLSRVEHGLDAAPTPARLAAMARELDVPATLLMDLAQRISPLVVDYVEAVPEAGTLFLEIAHRRLSAAQLAELRGFLDRRFPPQPASASQIPPRLASLLDPDRVVPGLACGGMDDVLDVAAGRLAGLSAAVGAAGIAAALKRREAEVSSAIGSGVAVPCAHLAGTAPIAVLVTLAEPIAYDTPDGQPLRVVVILAGPRDCPDRRLVLARVARLAARGLADALAGADSAAEVLARLAIADAMG